MGGVRQVLPITRRPLDAIFVAFFLVNLLFITYIVDFEQLVVADPNHFQYPLWPPGPLIDLVHWWGRSFDPVLLARPAWWKATIWIDALFFGPFYLVGIYAFATGKDWIRLPSVIWASVMLTNVTIILSEEMFGAFATPQLPMVLFANLAWLVMPLLMIARMARATHPFTTSPSDL
jgi:emopamil binding protein